MRDIPITLATLVLSSCSYQQLTQEPSKHILPQTIIQESLDPILEESHTSYKLSDLQDREKTPKEIEIYFNISPENQLYPIIKPIEKEIKGFFSRENISCIISYEPPDQTNYRTFTVEFLQSSKELADRNLELFPEANKEERNDILEAGYGCIGKAVIKKQTILYNSRHRKETFPMDSIRNHFKDPDFMNYIQKENAGFLLHEILHCCGLFHSETFRPIIIESFNERTPNIMTYYDAPLNITPENPLGAQITYTQRGMLNSYLGKNGMFKAMEDSDKNLVTLIDNIARENNLTVY